MFKHKESEHWRVCRKFVDMYGISPLLLNSLIQTVIGNAKFADERAYDTHTHTHSTVRK